jgi:hypothetical protein
MSLATPSCPSAGRAHVRAAPDEHPRRAAPVDDVEVVGVGQQLQDVPPEERAVRAPRRSGSRRSPRGSRAGWRSRSPAALDDLAGGVFATSSDVPGAALLLTTTTSSHAGLEVLFDALADRIALVVGGRMTDTVRPCHMARIVGSAPEGVNAGASAGPRECATARERAARAPRRTRQTTGMVSLHLRHMPMRGKPPRKTHTPGETRPKGAPVADGQKGRRRRPARAASASWSSRTTRRSAGYSSPCSARRGTGRFVPGTAARR